MKESELKIEGTFFTHVDIQANASFDAEKVDSIEMKTNIDFLRNSDEKDLWQVSLTIELDYEKNLLSPYTGKIEVVGVFRHASFKDDDEEETKLRRIIGANAPAILYSTAREMYLMVTGRGPWESNIWPTVHFQDTIPTLHSKKDSET